MTTAATTAHEGTGSPYALSHLDALESEAVHIFREVAGEFENPVILFSGGKDSIVMLHLALKAFTPAPVPFSLLHVDTGTTSPRSWNTATAPSTGTGCACTWRPCRTTSTAGCSRSAPTAPATRSRRCR